MRIGIISDIHGSLSAWHSSMENGLSTCDTIICCGDVLYHGPRNPLPEGYNPAELAAAINASGKVIHFAQGNCDAAVDQLLIDYPIQSPLVMVNHMGLAILAHHGDVLSDDDIRRFSRVTGVRLVVSGHTHLRVLDKREGMILLNPGSSSLPKTPDKRPSFAVLEDMLLSIKDVGDGSVIVQMHIDADFFDILR